MKNGKEAAGIGQISIRILKAALVAAVLTLALVLLYAFVLQQAWLNEGSIPVVNTVIKILGAAFTAFLCARRVRRSWLVGAAGGVVYILIAFVVFSIASDHISLSVALLSDMLMGALAGMLTGMLLQARK
ncbi:MAG: TIGR04086 family membrane protein [Bacillota bacterium]